ncbi:MAG: sugar-binding transcriptional regulator [Caldiserica bacterium]|nr:sugar-binding transcriptional regulator [Caldisericota bacterium]MDH7562702.1 sugar-binding transcriptional regulator [Caldisericota bacterium]
MLEVSLKYYVEELNQDTISKELHISRSKVSRLLKQAREEGLVEIRIRTISRPFYELEESLKREFHLKEVFLVPEQSDIALQRELIAKSAANFLEQRIQEGSVIAVGMGRNVGEIPKHFRPLKPINATFVSAMGGSTKLESYLNPNTISHSLAMKCGGKSLALYVPAFVKSETIRENLFNDLILQETFSRAKRADMAVVGIGTPSADCTLVKMECLSVKEVKKLIKEGAVGDILGYFFDRNGIPVKSDLASRLIGLTLDDLAKIPFVIGVVSEPEKVTGVLGALRTGIIKMLITSSTIAQLVLELNSLPG